MAILIAVLLLLVLAVGLVLGLLNVLRELFVQDAQTGPILQDPGPIFHEQCDDRREARSQFAWQSQSHCRGPD